MRSPGAGRGMAGGQPPAGVAAPATGIGPLILAVGTDAFETDMFLFLDNWPGACAELSAPGPRDNASGNIWIQPRTDPGRVRGHPAPPEATTAGLAKIAGQLTRVIRG